MGEGKHVLVITMEDKQKFSLFLSSFSSPPWFAHYSAIYNENLTRNDGQGRKFPSIFTPPREDELTGKNINVGLSMNTSLTLSLSRHCSLMRCCIECKCERSGGRSSLFLMPSRDHLVGIRKSHHHYLSSLLVSHGTNNWLWFAEGGGDESGRKKEVIAFVVKCDYVVL
jgi:hypothetical protein